MIHYSIIARDAGSDNANWKNCLTRLILISNFDLEETKLILDIKIFPNLGIYFFIFISDYLSFL